MISAILGRDGFVLDEHPMPTAGPGEIAVRTLALGICEGDLFHYRMRQEMGDEPLLLGHEGTGIVTDIGQGVNGLTIGDRVTTLGGPYATCYNVPAEMAVRLPEKMDPVYALGEPLACCVHASARFGVRPGDRVAMIGCGFMGMVCMQLARMQGAAEITAIAPLAWRRAIALALGADTAYAPDAVPALSDALQSRFDVVIEATGVQSGLDLVAPLTRQHGRAILIGYHQTSEGIRQVDMQQWNFKALDIINGHVRRNDEKLQAMRSALALLDAGLLRIEPLVTAYPLADIQIAFADLANRKEGLFKAVLIPEAAG